MLLTGTFLYIVTQENVPAVGMICKLFKMHPGDPAIQARRENRAGCAGLSGSGLTRLQGDRIQISFPEWGWAWGRDLGANLSHPPPPPPAKQAPSHTQMQVGWGNQLDYPQLNAANRSQGAPMHSNEQCLTRMLRQRHWPPGWCFLRPYPSSCNRQYLNYFLLRFDHFNCSSSGDACGISEFET